MGSGLQSRIDCTLVAIISLSIFMKPAWGDVCAIPLKSPPIEDVCDYYRPALPEIYEAADGRCKGVNLHLPGEYGKPELQELLDHMGEAKLAEIWLGLMKIDDVWTWSDGSQYNGENLKGGNNHCAILHKKGDIHAKRCSTNHWYICQKTDMFSANADSEEFAAGSDSKSRRKEKDNDDDQDEGNKAVYIGAGIGGVVLVVIIILLVLVIFRLRKKNREMSTRTYFEIHASSMSREDRDRHSTLTSIKNKPHIRLFSELLHEETTADSGPPSRVSRHEYCEVDVRPWGADDRCASTDPIVVLAGESHRGYADSTGGPQMVDNVVYDEKTATLDSGHFDLDDAYEKTTVTIVDNNMYTSK